jgi:hypothetical protein
MRQAQSTKALHVVSTAASGTIISIQGRGLRLAWVEDHVGQARRCVAVPVRPETRVQGISEVLNVAFRALGLHTECTRGNAPRLAAEYTDTCRAEDRGQEWGAGCDRRRGEPLTVTAVERAGGCRNG